LKELKINSGIQFDEVIVDTFIKLYQEQKFTVSSSGKDAG
jgi:hypothetical protein